MEIDYLFFLHADSTITMKAPYTILINCVFIILQVTSCPLTKAEILPEKSKQDSTQEIFLTLEDTIDLALRANRNIVSSRLAMQSQRMSLTSAVSEFDLKFLPSASAEVGSGGSIGMGFSLVKRFYSGTSISMGTNINRGDLYTTEVELSLEQPLLRGLGKEVNLDHIHSEEFSLRSVRRAFYQTRVSTVLETVVVVYEVIKQERMVHLYESMIKRLRMHLALARTKEQAGLASAMDIYRGEIRLKDAEDSLASATEALRNAADRLKLILALPVDTVVKISAPLEIVPVRIGEQEAIDIALKNRVEMAQARDELSNAIRKAKVMRRRMLPELKLVFDYTRSASSDVFEDSFALDDDRWGILLVSTTDIPMISEKTAYHQSRVDIDRKRINLEILKEDIKREVRKGLLFLRKTEKRMEIIREQIIQAEGKLALSEVKFRYDMANNFDLIEAETELQQARIKGLLSNIDYIIGIYRLKAHMGTLIESGREEGS
jgi:outer membrane protein TolC